MHILPGRPQSTPQALRTALWDGLRVVVYLSGNAVVILGGPQKILQTIYIDEVESLEAVTIEEASGKIAVCGAGHVYIYQPLGRDEGVLKWSQQHDLNSAGAGFISTLSWGSSEELLVGGASLTLWNVADNDEPSIIWEDRLAGPVRLARISYDGGLIASCGTYDRLVKIWRRLSYELDSTRFDVSYLPHPTTVTNLHWRKPWHSEQNLDNLLYTFCAADRIRIWTHSDPHARAVMQFVAEIDMQSSIQSRTPLGGLTAARRYGFVLDSRDFSIATEKAVQRSTEQAAEHAMEHLIEVASRSPEVCIVLDEQGHISAWGLENAGCKNRLPSTVFNVVHVKGMGIPLTPSELPLEDYVQFCIFAGGTSESSLTILAHYFNGRVDWYDAPIAELFDPAPREVRSRLMSSWTGHDALISTLKRESDTSIMISCTDRGQVILWKEGQIADGPALQMIGSLEAPISSDSRLHACCLAHDKLIAVVSSDGISIWNTERPHLENIANERLSSRSRVIHLVSLPHDTAIKTKERLVSVHADMTSTLWEIYVPSDIPSDSEPNGYHQPLRRVCDFNPGPLKAPAILTSVPYLQLDPRDAVTQACLISLSPDGVVHRLSASFDENSQTASWQILSTAQVSISNPSFVSANITQRLAVVDLNGTRISIWDAVDGQLEFEQQFANNDTIEKISWSSTPHGQSILAVGCSYKILILAQLQYRHTEAGPAWKLIREIRTRDFGTHSLGDLCWLRQGNLVIGIGNQMFINDQDTEADGTVRAQLRLQNRGARTYSLLGLVDRLNASLPVFHPSLLTQLRILGQYDLVHRVLLALHRALKFASQGDALSSLLDMSIKKITAFGRSVSSSNPSAKMHVYSNSVSNGIEEDEERFTLETAEILEENLSKVALWQISKQEQSNLSDMARLFASTEKHRKSVDEDGFRFLHAFYSRDYVPDEARPFVSWRSTAFASHSTSQEVLVDLVSRSFAGKLTWQNARKSGIFMWLSDHNAVRAQMEVVARTEYTEQEDRNPVDCSLYYLALGKKNVLQGLWRMCVGNREKENTLKLLAHNFTEPRWRTTALKNAYVLLSKRRFEYAAAFFLLGGSLKDAVNVCVHQIGQLELGIAIARVWEGDNGPVLQTLLTDIILPNAADTGNRWMASWAFEMLGRKDKAVQALVRPLHTLLADATSGLTGGHARTMAPTSFRANEPSLVVLYKRLRAELAKEHKWADVTSPKEEWNFIMRCVRQYIRMGCDLLALELVRNWEFLAVTPKVVDRKNDIVVQKLDADDADEKTQDTKTESNTKPQPKERKPPPTHFQEPSASSLLDSFGF